MTYDNCPACSGAVTRYDLGGGRYLVQCNVCQAIGGEVDRATGEAVAKPTFHPDPNSVTAEFYFDFVITDALTPTRRHGWYDAATGLLTQVG